MSRIDKAAYAAIKANGRKITAAKLSEKLGHRARRWLRAHRGFFTKYLDGYTLITE